MSAPACYVISVASAILHEFIVVRSRLGGKKLSVATMLASGSAEPRSSVYYRTRNGYHEMKEAIAPE